MMDGAILINDKLYYIKFNINIFFESMGMKLNLMKTQEIYYQTILKMVET